MEQELHVDFSPRMLLGGQPTRGTSALNSPDRSLLVSPAPVRRANLTALILDELRQFVLARGLVENDRLPPEREMSVHLRVSRPTLRKALAWLEERGALRRVQGGGTFLQPQFLDVIADASELPLPGRAAPDHVFEARLLLEPTLAAWAAERATPRALETLEAELRRGQPQAGEGAHGLRWRQHETNFHLRLMQAGGNAPLAAAGETLLHQAYPSGFEASRHGCLEASWREHAAIFAAVAGRQPETARRLVIAHLNAQAHLPHPTEATLPHDRDRDGAANGHNATAERTTGNGAAADEGVAPRTARSCST